jgi:thioredoxin reductase
MSWVETMTRDVAIVGAGPVGLHAALKVALLGMSAVVVDKSRKRSRAFYIPRMENIPGMPGVSGAKLMQLQRQNLDNYRDRVQIVDDTEVIDIVREGDIFVLKCARCLWSTQGLRSFRMLRSPQARLPHLRAISRKCLMV